MTTEQMKARKIELGLTSKMIADASGVPLSTVQKIFSGATKAPRRMTIAAIENVLADRREKGYDPEPVRNDGGTLRETAASYHAVPKDRLHTIDDYYALPEDRRVELIDGVFYDMGAPALVHQIILGELYVLFRECAARHGMPCHVMLSPCGVRLDRDNYTMVQPDLLVTCGKPDIHAVRIEGAPDLIVEILSPSTLMKDMILKLHKYQSAGVREYWIVDPKHLTVTIHYFDTEDYDPQKYDFRSVIPVSISGGACSIDFSEVADRLEGFADH